MYTYICIYIYTHIYIHLNLPEHVITHFTYTGWNLYAIHWKKTVLAANLRVFFLYAMPKLFQRRQWGDGLEIWQLVSSYNPIPPALSNP